MSTAPAPGRAVRLLQGLLLAAASLVFCALALELGLRLFWSG